MFALVPTVSRDAASKLLEGLPDRHSKARAQLRQQHQQHYAAWLFELEAGFSLCFYGFGSKRSLLRVGFDLA
jgi:origin recognition complex subunit 2